MYCASCFIADGTIHVMESFAATANPAYYVKRYTCDTRHTFRLSLFSPPGNPWSQDRFRKLWSRIVLQEEHKNGKIVIAFILALPAVVQFDLLPTATITVYDWCHDSFCHLRSALYTKQMVICVTGTLRVPVTPG